MKAIVKTRREPGGLELRDLPIPQPKPNEALIKIKKVAICGTDLHIYNWDAWSQQRLKLPRVIGHEFAGEIVAVGDQVKRFAVGEYVSGEGHLFCGVCQMCRTGQGHICEDWLGLGYDTDGAFAEYLTLPEVNLWRNDPAVPPEMAAIQDPFGNAVHAVFAADCVTKKVVVFGCGPVGLMAVAVLHAIGAATIIALDKGNPYRMDMARRMGATHVLDVGQLDDVPAAIRAITGGKGADVVIEIAGTKAAVRAAVQSVHPGGDLVLLGLPAEPVSFDVSEEIVFKAICIHGICGRRIYDTWYRMAGLLKNPNLKLREIITHHFPFDDYEQGFQLMRQGNCGKVILDLA
jgi:threonine 3-dehydrogenase